MTIDQQIERAKTYLALYRKQQVDIDTNVTYWFESIIESLERLKELTK